MKRFAMALALMCVLAPSIVAGDMPTGGRFEPPPAQVAGNMPTGGRSDQPTQVAGEMPAGGRSDQPPTTSSTSTLLASVILAVLSLR